MWTCLIAILFAVALAAAFVAWFLCDTSTDVGAPSCETRVRPSSARSTISAQSEFQARGTISAQSEFPARGTISAQSEFPARGTAAGTSSKAWSASEPPVLTLDPVATTASLTATIATGTRIVQLLHLQWCVAPTHTQSDLTWSTVTLAPTTSTTVYTIIGLSPGTAHWVRARAVEPGLGLAPSTFAEARGYTLSSHDLNAAPPAPVPSAVQLGAGTLSWPVADDATLYWAETWSSTASSSGSFSAPSTQLQLVGPFLTPTATATFVPPTDNSDAVHACRLTAWKPDARATTSTITSALTWSSAPLAAAPSAPVLTATLASSSLLNLTVSRPATLPSHYLLQWAATPSAPSASWSSALVAASFPGAAASQTFALPTTLLLATAYGVRVAALDTAAHPSPFVDVVVASGSSSANRWAMGAPALTYSSRTSSRIVFTGALDRAASATFASQYRVERTTDGAKWTPTTFSYSATSQSLSVTGLVANTAYAFRLAVTTRNLSPAGLSSPYSALLVAATNRSSGSNTHDTPTVALGATDATAGTASVVVSWTGQAPTSLRIVWMPVGGAAANVRFQTQTVTTTGAGSATVTLPGMRPSALYDVRAVMLSNSRHPSLPGSLRFRASA
jgi:hypothetical protein